MSNQVSKIESKVNSGGLSLLKPASNTMAYFKMGLFGDLGSGKTFTASKVAVGLHKYIKAKKPVAFFDTETGSNFVKRQFDEAGIDLMTLKSTSLIQLSQVIDEAEKNCSVLIIDSISRVWKEFTEAYLEKSRSGFIELWDWQPIKKEWAQHFTDKFVNSKLHIIMCGRESGIYQEVEVQKGGEVKTQTARVGDKMQAEAQTGYEPSLLCQMTKAYMKDGGHYVRRCNVIKERFDVIDSMQFDNPEFKDFLPHVELLNIGGEHEGVDTTRRSVDLFDEPNNTWDKRKRQIEILLEKIKAKLVEADLDGTSVPAKKARVGFMKEFFGTTAWTEIESMKLEELQERFAKVESVDLNDWRIDFLKSVKDENQTKEKAVS